MGNRPACSVILLLSAGLLASCGGGTPRDIDPGATSPVSPGAQAFHAHGISFAYPGSWNVLPIPTPSGPDPAGALFRDAVGLDELNNVLVNVFGSHVRVTPEYFAAHRTEVESDTEAFLQALGVKLEGSPEPISVAGLPGLRWRISIPTTIGYVVEGTASVVFRVTTRYVIDCTHLVDQANAIEQGCEQILQSFAVEAAA